MSHDCCVVLPHSATGLSAVDCKHVILTLNYIQQDIGKAILTHLRFTQELGPITNGEKIIAG